MTAPDELPDPGLAGLPKSITPARDLWPGIEARLHRRRGAGAQGRMWVTVLAIAATIVIAFVVRRPGTIERTDGPTVESAELQQVLLATTGARSATAHSLAKYLSILDAAITETAAALRETPGDPALTEFLQTLERRRLTLLAQAARFAAES